MDQLGDTILRHACFDAVGWPETTTISVNISPIQLRSPTFALRVLGILKSAGLPPKRLEIEITENTLVEDLKTAQNGLTMLRAVGVKVALDDFGTGYSSLYHLRNFPVDRIKIDRSFVASMNDEQASSAIVNALLGLGHGLGVRVTAEGVETDQQREALLKLGCDDGQGFLFSRAVSAVEAKVIANSSVDRFAQTG
jgi:EAL domain-containing protein (putative c-di-GMP-specific phosphodiesterase class I)